VKQFMLRAGHSSTNWLKKCYVADAIDPTPVGTYLTDML
jgi:hypothetical protein